MKFAINYSHPAAELLATGRIQLDYFKTPDWPDLVTTAQAFCPVRVHFNLKAGPGRAAQSDWRHIQRLLEQTGTHYVNLHLVPEQEAFPGIPKDTTDPDHMAQVIERMLADVQAVVEQFGPEMVIVENVPYQPANRVLRPGVEPAAIRQVVETTGCGLLLDISHARIAARSLGMDEKEYIEQLPVERVRELHFTGLHWLDGRWRDHLSVLDEDWSFLDWVLERIHSGAWSQPGMLAFEYGGVGGPFTGFTEAEVIASQAPRLYATVSRNGRLAA